VYCHQSGGFQCDNTALHGKVPFGTLSEPLRPFAALSEEDKRATNGSNTYNPDIIIWPLLYIHGGPDCHLVFSNISIQDVSLGCPKGLDSPQVNIQDRMTAKATSCTYCGRHVCK
jgi:hypothetical protein